MMAAVLFKTYSEVFSDSSLAEIILHIAEHVMYFKLEFIILNRMTNYLPKMVCN